MKRNQTLLAFLLSSLIVFGVSGCFLFAGPTPDIPDRQEIKIETENPEYYPDGDATQNKDYFIYTLLDYSESEAEFSSSNIAKALLDAGFVKENIQISFDESLTHLPTDTITVSVLFENECLLGQIERKDREVFVFQTEAVGPDKNVCIIGNTAEF